MRKVPSISEYVTNVLHRMLPMLEKKNWASKKLVTSPNGIMVAQTFCDIFFMKKRHQISIYKQFSD